MDKTSKRKNSIAKAISKLSIDLLPSKPSKLKTKVADFQIQQTCKAQNIQSHLNLNRTNNRSKNTALDPISLEKVRISKKSSLRTKRNMSVEGLYDDIEPEERTVKRNSSLLDNYPKEELWDTSKLPYSPAAVLKLFAKDLTAFEQSEILGYRHIYYIAAGVHKLEPNPKEVNNGFDDERNDYILVKNDHIAYRYEILEIIGRGSYGQVIRAYDHKDKKLVALKIIRNLGCIIQQSKIEIQVLYKMLQQADISQHVVFILDNYIFRSHLVESFDLLDINLYQYIKTKQFKPVSTAVIKSFAMQILDGMKFYHGLGILHCDLKPENLMLNSDHSKVTIIDFGSACFSNKRVFSYIQSRYYRAPEVILEIGYDYKIDVWSLGCVLVELATGKPIFPGKDEIDQFFTMTEYLGLPPAYILEQSPKCPVIVEAIKKMANSGNSTKFRTPASKSLKQLLQGTEPNFLEFVSKCFNWNPHDRFTAAEALEHEWFKSNPIQRQPSLPDIRWDKVLSSNRNSNSKKKLTFEQPLTHRALRKNSIFQSNFA